MEALLDYRASLIVWTLASISIYALGANLLRLLRSPSSGRVGRFLRTFMSWPHCFWILQALRFIYYLCIPYVALTRGITNPALLGIRLTDPFEGIALGTAIGLGTLVLLIWGWRHYLNAIAEMVPQPHDRPFLIELRTLRSPWGWGLILLEVLYLEIHWAFYRGATIQLFGDYYGVFSSLVLILAEWWLSPDIRRSLGMAYRSGEVLTTAATALSISTIYYFSSSLWLCLAVHLVTQFGLLSFLALSYRLPDYEGQRN